MHQISFRNDPRFYRRTDRPPFAGRDFDLAVAWHRANPREEPTRAPAFHAPLVLSKCHATKDRKRHPDPLPTRGA
jgi:hypothetical protein